MSGIQHFTEETELNTIYIDVVLVVKLFHERVATAP
jgi:hypothetical protein